MAIANLSAPSIKMLSPGYAPDDGTFQLQLYALWFFGIFEFLNILFPIEKQNSTVS